VKENALIDRFNMKPIPFEGKHIDYLRNNTIGTALKKIIKGEAVN
jgi:hypothetical protein